MSFWKPDRNKIFLFLLFSLIFILKYNPGGGVGLGLFGYFVDHIPLNIFNAINIALLWIFLLLTIAGFIAGLIAVIGLLFAYILGEIGFLFGYILMIIYAYFLSCLIFWIYSKVRKRVV